MKTCVAGGWIASLNHVIVQTAFLEGWSTTFLCRGFTISVKTESGEHLTFKARQSWNKGWGNCDKTDFWTPCFLLLQSLPYRSCSLGSAPSIEWPWVAASLPPAGRWFWLLIQAGLNGRYFISRLFQELPLQSPSRFPGAAVCCQSDRSVIKHFISSAATAVGLETWWSERRAWKKSISSVLMVWFQICGTELAQTHRFRNAPGSLGSEFASGQVFNSLCFCVGAWKEKRKTSVATDDCPDTFLFFVPLLFTEGCSVTHVLLLCRTALLCQCGFYCSSGPSLFSWSVLLRSCTLFSSGLSKLHVFLE